MAVTEPSPELLKPKEGITVGTTDILIVIVLDKSGSMGGIREATISGFNAFIEDQKKLPGALVTLTMFDDDARLEYTTKPIEDVEDLTVTSYVPGGSTALFDAIMTSVVMTESVPGLPEKVLFVIITDGHENASKETRDRGAIRDAITRKTADGWEFVFLGANIDAFSEGFSMGVAASSTMSYDPTATSVAAMYAGTSIASTSYRTGERSVSATFDTLKDESGKVKVKKQA